MEELKDRFRAWLDGDDYRPFIIGEKNEHNLLIRVPCRENFDYLFGDYLGSNQAVQRGCKLNYCGIYHKGEHKIYDAHGWFKKMDPTLESDEGILEMADSVTDTVRSLIEQRLQDNVRNLTIRSLSSSKMQSDLQYATQYVAPVEARKMFLLHLEPEDVHFECEYGFARWKDTLLLDYLTDRDTFCQQEAEAYWAGHQEEMYLQFLINDAIQDELAELNAQEDSPLHRIREISEAVSEVSAKSVTVTVCKNGTECTFKCTADALTRDPGKHYSTWNIFARDRAQYESLFGRYQDFTPEEITQISYNGKTIYEAEPFEQEEDEGFEQSM